MHNKLFIADGKVMLETIRIAISIGVGISISRIGMSLFAADAFQVRTLLINWNHEFAFSAERISVCPRIGRRSPEERNQYSHDPDPFDDVISWRTVIR